MWAPARLGNPPVFRGTFRAPEIRAAAPAGRASDTVYSVQPEIEGSVKPAPDANPSLLMDVTRQDIRRAVRTLDLAGRPVCLHSSLSSFGHVRGGAPTVVQAFLEEGCTLIVPTFSSDFEIEPPPHLCFERNGWDYGVDSATHADPGRLYTPEASEIDQYMGAVPAAVVGWPGRVRGAHPLDSFTAVGARAAELASGQRPSDVYAPLDALARAGGFVVLAGVGLERMTLIHLAEKEAGRTLFRRWAVGEGGETVAVEVGGCSEGFARLESSLGSVARTLVVGQSNWRSFPAAEVLTRAAAAIRADPLVTHCGDAACARCNDAAAGGPLLPRR
jgi:aminoglycoside 3-N-acetyltransferase